MKWILFDILWVIFYFDLFEILIMYYIICFVDKMLNNFEMVIFSVKFDLMIFFFFKIGMNVKNWVYV